MDKRINKYFDYMSSNDVEVWLKVTKRRRKTVKALFEYFANSNFYFNSSELHEIYLGVDSGLAKEKIMIYADDKFNCYQMRIIREGLKRGYSVRTVKAYAKPEFSDKQMKAILDSLRNGADIEKLKPYIDARYGCKQLEVIGMAIICDEPRMDLITNPEYSAEYMEAIRENLIKYRERNVEYYIERYAKKNFSPAQLYHILYYACDGLDKYTNRQLDFIANPKFDERQMEKIAEGFNYGLDIEKVKLYAKPELNYIQMHKIMLCLSDGVLPEKIKPYITPKFDHMQLDEICEGLRRGYDVSIYAKECFDAEQMSFIFLALKDKVSKKKIATILNPMLTVKEMNLILEAYRKGATVEEVTSVCSGLYYDENALYELFQKYALIGRNIQLEELENLLS